MRAETIEIHKYMRYSTSMISRGVVQYPVSEHTINDFAQHLWEIFQSCMITRCDEPASPSASSLGLSSGHLPSIHRPLNASQLIQTTSLFSTARSDPQSHVPENIGSSLNWLRRCTDHRKITGSARLPQRLSSLHKRLRRKKNI